MPSISELCEKYYGTRDIYQLMGLTKDSLPKDVKKAYYKLSLQVHPDRVAENEKEIATEKFKVLSKLNTILTDKDKKALYDDKGIIEDDDDPSTSWMDLWKQFFIPISINDIKKYEQEYVGSDLEKTDIKKAYLNGKGCLNYMLSSVPFMQVEDEPRIQELVRGWIKDGEVPEYKAFTEEPKAKRSRRHKKYAKEALEAKAIQRELDAKAKNNDNESLEQQIMKRQQDRQAGMSNFFDKLMEKYGGDDNSEEFDLYEKVNSRKKSQKQKVASNGASSGGGGGSGTPSAKAKQRKVEKSGGNRKAPERKVKNGRVNK